MPIETKIELNPWQSPNFATVKQKPGLRQDGFKESPSIPVADLTDDALDTLAAFWLDELYKKAGRSNPFTQIRRD